MGAALVYTVCEWAGGLVFEVANIWRCDGYVYRAIASDGIVIARKSTIPLHLRWIYILGRYVGLVGQIFEARIGIILSLLVALVEVAALATGAVAVKSMQHQDHCLVMPHFPGEAIYGITVVTVVVQACIGGLGLVKATSLRRESFSTKLNWVVTRVSRESILVAALSCVLPASVIVDGIWSKFEADITVMTHLAFPVFLAISTSTSCRMIQSMHQVKKEVEEIPGSLLGEDSLVLTSIGFET
ncbi:hypothetical protein D9756_007490 [Leucocoprinus leucothites]|uniref:Uncharacterized protein n=1 Tax=Leucocoprinus leucothites TaxID=201217 RepID=A0A8H5D164_9AGAR|nr:hypothetical protein D9756_007490 [Leucoagaricus leucothites]